MSAAPRIPMRVEELPQQRVTLVVPLPARPDGFVGLGDPPGTVWGANTRSRAPHKPLLLLAVMDLVARGVITTRRTASPVSWSN